MHQIFQTVNLRSTAASPEICLTLHIKHTLSVWAFNLQADLFKIKTLLLQPALVCVLSVFLHPLHHSQHPPDPVAAGQICSHPFVT